MGFTKYGEYIRILRIKHGEVMGDLAKILGTSLPNISAVENGKKNIPEAWIPIIIEHYSLNDSEQNELFEAVEESKTQVKIKLTTATNPQRKVAVQFQRSFENLDDETANAIYELLKMEDE